MYNTEEEMAFVVDNLLIQISNAETLQERREILRKLVDRLDMHFIHALYIAYQMTTKVSGVNDV